MKTRLREGEQYDLRVCAHPHGRTPGTGAAGRVDLHGAEGVETVGELAECAASGAGSLEP